MKRFAPEVVTHALCQTGNARIILISVMVLLGNVLLGQDWEQLIKVVAPDRDTTRFAHAVAISGDFAVIGTYQETKDVNGNIPLPNAGAAYIFMRNGCDWNFVQKIIASDRAAQDNFGYFVDIEGEFIMVGALREDEDENGNNFQLDAGAVYVFKNISGTWTQTQKLVASDRFTNDAFSVSLAISGNYAVIGAYQEDEDASGMNTVSNAGSAYVFLNTNGTWAEVQKIHATVRGANDNFGISVGISGDYIVSGAYNEDEDADEMNFLNNAGSAYVFKNTSGTWAQVQKIVNADRAANDRFGWGVAISGDHIVSGAPNEDEDENGANTVNGAGSAYIFQNQSNVWTQVKKIVTSDRGVLDGFGSTLAISGDYILGNCYREDEDCNGMNTLTDAGSAYMFKKVSGVWSEYQKLCRNDRDAGDFFSFRVDISGDYALIGSHLDDDNVEGMDSLNNSGSAYFFKLGTCVSGIESVQSGDWNDPDTWNCNCIPIAADDVSIVSPHTVYVTDTSACATLSVALGATLYLSSLLENNGQATFSGTVSNEGTLAGSGNKIITSGGLMNSAGALRGTGEIEVADGGTLSFTEAVENRFAVTIHNHGTLNWSNGYYTNGDCTGMATIINEVDGEFVMGGFGTRFLSRTNLINHGLITKNTDATIYINSGCGSGNGYFDNIAPGLVNITDGTLGLNGNGTHSGNFTNSATLRFNANMTLTTSGNVTGSGTLIIQDTTIINIPYTFAISNIANNGLLTGSGNKVLPSGTMMTSSGILSGTGELEIQDGASLTFTESVENQFYITIHNHGTIDWSQGYYTNSNCMLGTPTITNETDGELIFGGASNTRFFSGVVLTNYGLITKNTDATIYINNSCGNGAFQNISPGIVNITGGSLSLDLDGTHSGTFNNTATLIFNADHALTTSDNITGSGEIQFHDTMMINVPYTFPAATIGVYGIVTGAGQKTLPSGSILNMYNTWTIDGETEIQDGAVLNYQGIYISNILRNHGVVNWNAQGWNACGSISTFINESDGEFNIAAGGYFSRTNLVNSGIITKSSNNQIYMNAGCGNDGTFENNTPGVVNILDGEFHLYGDGDHSGMFNNNGLLNFNADHELTTSDNITGSGNIQVHDSVIINVPYTFPAAQIRVEGTVTGMGAKTLPAGAFLDLYNTWNVAGELMIQDGATVDYQGIYLGNMIRNHGTVNWNSANFNTCGAISTFTNESDGELNIVGSGTRYLGNTNLINSGLITKSTLADIHFNSDGSCNYGGSFENLSPGELNVAAGTLTVH